MRYLQSVAILSVTSGIVGCKNAADIDFGELRRDLVNVAGAQAAYFAVNHRYAPTLSQLPNPYDAGRPYQPHSGVHIIITRGDSSGWEVSATHTHLRARCTFRDAAPPRPTPGTAEMARFCVDAP